MEMLHPEGNIDTHWVNTLSYRIRGRFDSPEKSPLHAEYITETVESEIKTKIRKLFIDNRRSQTLVSKLISELNDFYIKIFSPVQVGDVSALVQDTLGSRASAASSARARLSVASDALSAAAARLRDAAAAREHLLHDLAGPLHALAPYNEVLTLLLNHCRM